MSEQSTPAMSSSLTVLSHWVYQLPASVTQSGPIRSLPGATVVSTGGVLF